MSESEDKDAAIGSALFEGGLWKMSWPVVIKWIDFDEREKRLNLDFKTKGKKKRGEIKI